MLTALVLASLAQFPVIIEQSGPVVYDTPTMETMTYQSSYTPMFFSAPMVRYSLPSTMYSFPLTRYSFPSTYYWGAEPLAPVSLYPAFGRGRVIFRDRGPGPLFRGKMILRY